MSGRRRGKRNARCVSYPQRGASLSDTWVRVQVRLRVRLRVRVRVRVRVISLAWGVAVRHRDRLCAQRSPALTLTPALTPTLTPTLTLSLAPTLTLALTPSDRARARDEAFDHQEGVRVGRRAW